MSHSHIVSFCLLSFKNLQRRIVRTILTVLGVVLAVAVAVALAGFVVGYRAAIDRSIDMLGFQVMIMAKGCPYEAATMMLKGGSGLLYLPSDVYSKVKTDPDVESITPVFIGIAEKEATSIRDDAQSSFAIISGIDVDSFRTMKPWLAFKKGAGFDGGRWFGQDSTTEVVMGFEAAEYEQRKVGDIFYASITPNGGTAPKLHEFKVVGVLDRTGTQDDGTVFVPIKAAQALFNRPTSLTILGIKLKEFSPSKMREFEGRWLPLPEVQVVGLQQVKTTLMNLVGTAQTMVAAVAIIAVIVAIIGVVNTILMSVYERTGEIGIMKAIGARRGDIFELIWFETLVICLAGGVVGCAMAYLGASIVEAAIRALVDLGVQGSLVHITPMVLVAALGGAMIVGFFAGLYPAWRASSMRPIEAIRAGE
jgi:putative ABC transport system permease protein